MRALDILALIINNCEKIFRIAELKMNFSVLNIPLRVLSNAKDLMLLFYSGLIEQVVIALFSQTHNYYISLQCLDWWFFPRLR